MGEEETRAGDRYTVKKIPSLFKRRYDGDRQVYDEIVPGSEWVAAGEGIATRKWDGTSCLVKGGKLYKRYDAKGGKVPPPGFEPAQEPDAATGHWPGWVPVGDGPEDRWHREAIRGRTLIGLPPPDGTYELIGPKVNGGAEGVDAHGLVPHALWEIVGVPRTFADLRAWLDCHAMEGLVWHHPDGRMVKIKRRDFGLPWPIASARTQTDEKERA